MWPLCQLPGQDLNLDIESQNAFGAERKSLPDNTSGERTDPLTAPLTCAPADPDLARVCAAWESLSEVIRRGIVALVEAAGG